MKLEEVQRNWNAFGDTMPLRAILSMADHWDTDAFFATGSKEIGDLMAEVDSLAISVQHGRALDFGCGVGRLSQALAAYFEEVCGVDIAPSMIDLARQYNQHGTRCRYYLNESNDLRQFPTATFDLIYSNITLQHIKPRYSRNYLREFLRLLTPQGLLVFQLPSVLVESNPLKRALRSAVPDASIELYRRAKRLPLDLLQSVRGARVDAPRMEMYGIERGELIRFIEACGGRVIESRLDRSETAHSQWVNYRYFVTRTAD